MNLYQKYGVTSLKVLEHAILIIITIATITAIGQEVMHVIDMRRVSLADLLLLFIYLEVLAMVANYAESGKLPVRMPIYIAIVALARYLILDMKSMDDWRIIAIAASTLMLASTVIIIRIGQLKFPYPKLPSEKKRQANEAEPD
ncbi:phosphate-starvation-inducible protein PsiE [Paraferrimonas haliotis]|uniref:Protein PsiE n=1 Tax=Paraferrimonas haliotis TaxID=2013866 RepID=A0AA37TK32_9GAMM|nr:phosphate-starvation-inducible PsiE family protein [Paraferrimonas haliotis]GLS82927.1 phosphate starvation protein PhoH [Paraferrimonas haliotis]